MPCSILPGNVANRTGQTCGIMQLIGYWVSSAIDSVGYSATTYPETLPRGSLITIADTQRPTSKILFRICLAIQATSRSYRR